MVGRERVLSNVTKLPCITTLDIPPDTVLEAAMGKLESVVVIGWNHEGDLYVAGTSSKPAEVAWLIENAKQLLFELDK